jgi:transketolase
MTAGSAFDYAYLGCTHHCYSDFALLKTLPGTQLFYPASYVELECLFRQAYRMKVLNYFRLPMYEHDVLFEASNIQSGKGIQVSEGKDLTLIAVGSQLKAAIQALPLLAAQKISTDLIYIHTVKPLDYSLINQSLAKTRRCVVIEEHGIYGGVRDDVLRGSQHMGDVKISSIAIPDQFIREYGTYEEHCQRLGFTAENITHKARSIV